MVGNWIRKMTGVRWPIALIARDVLTDDLLADRRAYAGSSLGAEHHGVAQVAGTTDSTTPVAQPATYRYAGQPEARPRCSAARTGASPGRPSARFPKLWRSWRSIRPMTPLYSHGPAQAYGAAGDSGVTWARIDSLPGRPIALAFAGEQRVPPGSSSPAPILRASTAAWIVARPGRLPVARCLPSARDLSP